MLQDKQLIRKLRHGDADGLRLVYEKYKNNMLALALSFCSDSSIAEDVVHDVFVGFAKRAGGLNLRYSIKSYLAVSVVNRIRSLGRLKRLDTVQIDGIKEACSDSDGPVEVAIGTEIQEKISAALTGLPDEQREVIILHLQGGLKFREIAKSQQISTNTVQARYRYGLDKLRALLNGEVQK